MKTLAGLVAAAAVLAGSAAAQDFPSGPIHIIVPFGAGGNTDVTARTIAPALSEILGEPVVVENRTGAGGMIAAEYVMSQPADGQTLMMGTNSTLSVGPNLQQDWPYDPVEGVTPIVDIQHVPFALVVRADSDIRSVDDLLARAEENPGAITLAHAGLGSSNHLVSELFQMLTGAEFLFVPYQGGAAAMTDLLGGQVDIYFDQASTTVPQVQAGQVRALAVAAAERMESLPDAPTFAELGVEDFEITNFTGLVGPAGMDPAVVEEIREATVQALADPQVQQRFEEMGVMVAGNTPEEFAALIREDLERWRRVIDEAGVQIQ